MVGVGLLVLAWTVPTSSRVLPAILGGGLGLVAVMGALVGLIA